MKTNKIPGIPTQEKGGFHNTESRKEFDDPETTLQNFAVLKTRFYSINEWKDFCGEGFADFRLFDALGNPIEREPKAGDYVRIDIPGPGGSEAKGFDWVQIVEVNDHYTKDDEFENLLITCSPSKDPTNPKSSHIAHFYSSKATSTFMISRGNNYIHAAVYGRNESINTNACFTDKIRNMFIAIGGIMGFSKIQWKRLSDGLLDFNQD